jgi:DNA-binding SARP family transcriptional activator
MAWTSGGEPAVEIRLLGPLEVSVGARAVTLPGGKARALLACLALQANRTVSVTRLIDDLWGAAPPQSAAKMVQIYVSQLRKALPPGTLRTRAAGYSLALPPNGLDVMRFERLRAEGRAALAAGDAAAASDRLRDALALWLGPALGEFSEPFAMLEAAHLEELHIACTEDRIDADIAAGRHGDVVGELAALAARYPFREGLHARLMVALYRGGRHAEALSAYERYRRTVDDGLGIAPSRALRELQRQILIQGAELDGGGSRSSPTSALARWLGGTPRPAAIVASW